MNKQLLNALKFLIFLGLGFGILYYVFYQQNLAYQEECLKRGIAEADCSLIGKVLNDFAGANFGWLAVVLVCFTISNISRALRWNMLLRQLGAQPRFINAFLTINLGYFANLGLPRIGEVVRGGTMARYEKIGVEKVMGTIVVGRTIDVISILLLTGLALVLAFDKITAWLNSLPGIAEKLDTLKWLAILGGSFGIIVLALGWYLRERLLKIAFFQKALEIVKGFAQGLTTIKGLESPLLFVMHSIIIWVMYYLMTYLCLFAFFPTAHLGPIAGLITFVAGGWGIVVPSPGGMGSYHLMTQAALVLYGIAGDDAFSWSNIAFFSINIGCNVAIGLLALLLLPRINANYNPIQAGEETN